MITTFDTPAINEYLATYPQFHAEVFEIDEDYEFECEYDDDTAPFAGTFVARFTMPEYLDSHSSVYAESAERAIIELEMFTENYLLD